MSQYLGSMPAHPLPPGSEWLNVERPATLQQLRGRLLLLYFWSYTSVHTHHALPHLAALRMRHRGKVEVLAVHSSLFPAERRTENVRHAARRLRVELPLINDPQEKIVDLYGVASRPTLLFVDPLGNAITRHIGALSPGGLEEIVGRMLAEFTAEGHIDASAKPLEVRPPQPLGKALAYPTGLDFADGRLHIADCGNRRVVEADADGAVRGEVERAGGKPFGLLAGVAAGAGHTYIADAGRHIVARMPRGGGGEAEVIAGTGENALVRHGGGGEPVACPLSSPLDLAVSGDWLYIAMAGFHQIWRMDIAGEGRIEPWVGDGKAGIRDSEREEARLCQPCALAGEERGSHFFIDNQTSAVRAVNMADAGRVVTMVGESVLDYGDQDAVGRKARLQHPGGVVRLGDAVWVADTHNNKIKVISLSSLRIATMAGDGEAGHRDGPAGSARFDYPTALASDGRAIYVADTNNHAVRRLDPVAGVVETVELRR